jgi:hypothetical protein
MKTIEIIRNGLIDKILTIKNKEFLETIDKFVSSGLKEDDTVALSEEQKIMLEMSEEDIKSGNLISQEAMKKRNLEWLNAL